MRRSLLNTLGLIVLGVVALGTGPVQAQTVAPGPYYANPSWDQTLACTTLAACPRFIVLSNMNSQAVLDRETGLVWEKSPSANTFTWLDAQGHCNRLSMGGRVGWRLPTLQDLASLKDPNAAPIPLLPAGHPFTNVQASAYWSATTSAASSSDAWGVDFSIPGAGFGNKSGSFFVWCVRGGQGVDPQ